MAERGGIKPARKTTIPRPRRVEGASSTAEKPTPKPVETSPRKALAATLEAGTSTPHATLEDLSTGKFIPSKERAGNTEGEVPNSTPFSAETGKTPEATKPEVAKPIDDKTTVDAVTSVAHAEIETHVSESLKTWESANPEPNRDADPDGFADWAYKRGEVRDKAQTDGTVNAALKSWDKDNPPPDKDKNPKAYKEWSEKRTKTENDLRGEVEKRDENENVVKDEKNTLTVQEIQRKMRELQDLQEVLGVIKNRVKLLTDKGTKTKDDLANIKISKTTQTELETQIKAIQAELGIAYKKMPLRKKLMIGALLLAGGGAMFIAGAAKDTPSQPH